MSAGDWIAWHYPPSMFPPGEWNWPMAERLTRLAPLTTLRYSGGEMANEWPDDERIGWRVVCRENVSQVGVERGRKKKANHFHTHRTVGGFVAGGDELHKRLATFFVVERKRCYLLHSLEIHRASSAIYISIHHSGIDTLFNTKYCGKW